MYEDIPLKKDATATIDAQFAKAELHDDVLQSKWNHRVGLQWPYLDKYLKSTGSPQYNRTFDTWLAGTSDGQLLTTLIQEKAGTIFVKVTGSGNQRYSLTHIGNQLSLLLAAVAWLETTNEPFQTSTKIQNILREDLKNLATSFALIDYGRQILRGDIIIAQPTTIQRENTKKQQQFDEEFDDYESTMGGMTAASTALPTPQQPMQKKA